MSKICLNMIVKKDSPDIQRCLESVKPWIDRWIIVDSSSGNGEASVRQTLQGIPGEFHKCPWVSDVYNMNVALQFARGKSEYLLMIDPEDELIASSAFAISNLKDDVYVVTQSTYHKYTSAQINQMILYKNYLKMKWVKSESGSVQMLWINLPHQGLIFGKLEEVTTRSINKQRESYEL